MSFTGLFFLGLIAMCANILGGLFLLPSRQTIKHKNPLRYLVGLGAGFLLATIFIEIIPKSMAIWLTRLNHQNIAEVVFFPMTLLLGGYLLVQFLEHTIVPHFHFNAELPSAQFLSTTTIYAALGGLLVHTFFDGVSLASAATVDIKVGLILLVAIFLHKLAEGLTVCSLVLASGKSFQIALLTTFIIGLATLFGVLIFAFLQTNFDFVVAYTLPLAAGVTLYVAASDLIPEVNHHDHNKPLISLAIFGGVALFFALHYLLELLIEH
jgi:zinc transporter ZupT